MVEMKKSRSSKRIVRNCQKGLHFKRKRIEANFFDPFENKGRIYNHNLPSKVDLQNVNSSYQEVFPSSNYRFNIAFRKTTRAPNTSGAMTSDLQRVTCNLSANPGPNVILRKPRTNVKNHDSSKMNPFSC